MIDRRKRSGTPRIAPSSVFGLPTEHEECKALMQWAAAVRWNGIRLDRLLIHVPNGAYHGSDRKTAAIIGKKLREIGMKSGVFDYVLPVPIAGICPGLWLEMKRTRRGEVSDDQIKFSELMRRFGWRCEISKGWIEAKHVIEQYLAQVV